LKIIYNHNNEGREEPWNNKQTKKDKIKQFFLFIKNYVIRTISRRRHDSQASGLKEKKNYS
jgi:hypothetical protein